ncbi:oxidoreductase [Psychromonas sp. B3M02]|uniref:zinc-binding dehydrogenase n=1 Tax=Psychromonas sp. B3M02 TaxID=2267226 RepID=UPI000DEA2E43|nr:zinc-binding dehydrogenase [Psychromonas sp. B3M02]RBW47951.1 oxidoreductase [Psychromonas sp. B3M02]
MPDFQASIQQTIPNTMQALALSEANDAFSLSEMTFPIPQCEPDELLVKIEYVGLNQLDGMFAKQGFKPRKYPYIVGLDAVGIVVKAAQGLYPNVGERVMWHANIAQQGVLSEYAKVPNFAVSVVPDNISAQQAASLPCPGMMALICLDKLHLKEGDTILIEAGAGAIGQFAIQFAKQRGADVFTTASKCNHKLLKQLGADFVFDYKDKKLCNKIKKDLGPMGFDAVLDSVGGEATLRNIELMRFCGRIACLKPLPTLDHDLMYLKAPNISVVSLGGAWIAKSLCAQQKMSFLGNLLLENLVENKIKLPQISEVEFDQKSVTEALHRQLNGGFTGKQIVKI